MELFRSVAIESEKNKEMKNVVRLAIYNRQKYGASNEFTTHLEVFKRRWETEPEISVVGVFCDVCSGTAKYEEKAELKNYWGNANPVMLI